MLVAMAVAGCSAGATRPALRPAPTPRPTSVLRASAPASSTTATAPVTTPPPATTTTVPPTSPPARSLAAAPTALLKAGVWTPIGVTVNGTPLLTAALLQGRAGGPLTGVVRIAASLARPVLYAGLVEPGGSWPNQGAVAPPLRAFLVAAFNSGFHTYASGGGWYDHGRTAVPLRAGAASLVIRADGSATVGMWGRDVSLTPDVVSVRQNLGLLVDNATNLSGTASWGATLGHVTYTWRSGLGVDAAGNLLYAAGPGLDAFSLAQVLIQAGAVRAMELDINPAFVGFAFYTPFGGGTGGTDLVPGMAYSPGHWLSGSARDFIAIFGR